VEILKKLATLLFGKSVANAPSEKRWMIDGVEVEKILVYFKDREATVDEMMMVVQEPRLKPQYGALQCSTEKWTKHEGEAIATTVARIANEVSLLFPGQAVTALTWPGTDFAIIAAFVTYGKLDVPMWLRNNVAVVPS